MESERKMKLTNLTKSVLAASALTVASFGANAGVVATAFLDMKELGIEIDVYGDGVADALPPGASLSDFVTILSSTRGGNTAGNFTGFPDATNGVDAILNGGSISDTKLTIEYFTKYLGI